MEESKSTEGESIASDVEQVIPEKAKHDISANVVVIEKEFKSSKTHKDSVTGIVYINED